MRSHSLRTLLAVCATIVTGLGAASPALAHATYARHSRTLPKWLVHRIGLARHITAGSTSATSTSTNWSGYAVTGANGSYTSVSTSWVQPAVTCTRRTAYAYAAFWDGLDGYNSGSVEQTGSIGYCAGSRPYYYAWYEMYPAASVTFANTVRPGDAMKASVTFSGTETYTLVLNDATQNWTQTKVVNETGLDRSSAEVIAEAPSSNTGILPLANFGTVNFSSALVNGIPLSSSSAGLEEITMTSGRGALEAQPGALGANGAFSDVWASL